MTKSNVWPSTSPRHLHGPQLVLLLVLLFALVSGNENDASDTAATSENRASTRRSSKVIVQDETVVDSSWPTLHDFDSDAFQRTAPLRNKMRYREYIKGCYQDASQDECDASERSRLSRNRNQPPTIRNVTDTGYTKLPIPSQVNALLQSFWKKNRQFAWTEFWQAGNTIRNHWQQNCSVLDLGRKDFPHHLSASQQHRIVAGVQQVLEEWTGEPLVLSASVGIRAYLENTVLAPHVDRLPFVMTAALHIAQHNIDEAWPLQLVVKEDDSGMPVLKNITSVPGEMVVYEGASVIHGRPYPLPSGSLELPVGGDPTYMAVLYLHFEPVGYTLQHTLDRQAKDDGVAESLYDEMPTTTGAMDKASKAAFERALAVQQERMQQSKAQEFKGKMELRAKDEVPRYVWDNYRDMYQQRFVFQHEPAIYPKPSKVIFGQISAHQAAALGDLLALKSLAAKDRYLLFKADLNGWRPLHEAARSGYADIIEYLLEEGADVNARTNDGLGGTALYWAEKDPKKNHKAIAILKRYGGLNIPPEYKDD